MADTPSGFDLGPLEADVMRLIWAMGEVQVEDVHNALSRERAIAYTTVMTVMSRLTAKGILVRQKEGRAYLYRAVHGQEQVAGSTLAQWSERFFGGRLMPAVSFLLGKQSLSESEIAELRRLLDQIEQQGKGGEER